MRRVMTLGLTLLLLWTTGMAMQNASQLRQRAQSVSLRWQQPILLDEHNNENNNLTFWTEEIQVLSAEYHTAESKTLRYTGDAALLYGTPCSVGAYPGPLDETGCVISSALAHQLFGSEDVVGLTVSTPEKSYSVRGVFRDEEVWAFLPDQKGPFTAAELAVEGDTYHDPDGWVEQKLRQMQLPEPDWVLYPSPLAAFAGLAAWCPLFFASGMLLRMLWKKFRSQPALTQEILAFIGLLILVLALPQLLSAFPQWLIPSRWSDFSWWSRIVTQLKHHGMDWLSAVPVGRDLSFKIGLIKQVAFLFMQGIFCEMLRCRLHHLGKPK